MPPLCTPWFVILIFEWNEAQSSKGFLKRQFLCCFAVCPEMENENRNFVNDLLKMTCKVLEWAGTVLDKKACSAISP
jgi:hypothetical protein